MDQVFCLCHSDHSSKQTEVTKKLICVILVTVVGFMLVSYFCIKVPTMEYEQFLL